MMAYHVYILRSKEGDVYVGMTQDLERRLREHNTGESKYSRRSSHWKVVYQEILETRQAARAREKYLKSHAGKEWLQRRGIL